MHWHGSSAARHSRRPDEHQRRRREVGDQQRAVGSRLGAQEVVEHRPQQRGEADGDDRPALPPAAPALRVEQNAGQQPDDGKRQRRVLGEVGQSAAAHDRGIDEDEGRAGGGARQVRTFGRTAEQARQAGDAEGAQQRQQHSGDESWLPEPVWRPLEQAMERQGRGRRGLEARGT
ncbi:MAG: hypothetical protein FJX64_01395 [Alphaproteobacteria bacterium]|nr:hypothetical protein [Alphaproteobacteria bacterium]